nr:hypothetical protein CFP56_60193 [Quercus suber]
MSSHGAVTGNDWKRIRTTGGWMTVGNGEVREGTASFRGRRRKIGDKLSRMLLYVCSCPSSIKRRQGPQHRHQRREYPCAAII